MTWPSFIFTYYVVTIICDSITCSITWRVHVQNTHSCKCLNRSEYEFNFKETFRFNNAFSEENNNRAFSKRNSCEKLVKVECEMLHIYGFHLANKKHKANMHIKTKVFWQTWQRYWNTLLKVASRLKLIINFTLIKVLSK